MASKRDIIKELKRLKEVAIDKKDSSDKKKLADFQTDAINKYEKEIDELREAINVVVGLHRELRNKLSEDTIINGGFLGKVSNLAQLSGNNSSEIKSQLRWNSNFYKGPYNVLEHTLNKEKAELSREWDNLISNINSMNSKDAMEYLKNLEIDLSSLDTKGGCVAIMCPIDIKKLGIKGED